jgi:nicotinamidase/pyrazinamidase
MSIDARCALLIIDVQNDFCSGGALEVPGGDAVVPLINRLGEKFDTRVLTQDWHPASHSSFASSHAGRSPFDMTTFDYGEQILWPDHCVQGSRGAQFHADLETGGAALVIRKGFRTSIDSYSAFFENDHQTATGLTGYLRTLGLQHLFLVGLATDFCVGFTALDARSEGFDVTLIDDACAGIDIDGSVEAMREQMRAAGVVRTTSESVT